MSTIASARLTRAHRPFTLVLSGGGARGYAHAGVLRALEHLGFRPSAIVGVSMGAIVGGTYGLNPEWFSALLAMDTTTFPEPMPTLEERRGSWRNRIRARWLSLEFGYRLVTGWGIGASARADGLHALRALTRGRRLEEARPPLAVCATDLRGGSRRVIRTGDATEAIYASVALAGVLPPLERDGYLLADGAYSDLAPIDVARDFGHEVVIGVDPGQDLVPEAIQNGLQALRRAVEVCNRTHAKIGLESADLVIRPDFRRTIDTLDFASRRACVAAGIRGVRSDRRRLEALLVPNPHDSGPDSGRRAA